MHGRWETAAEDKSCVAWWRRMFDEAAPLSTGGVYVNFLTEDEGDRGADRLKIRLLAGFLAETESVKSRAGSGLPGGVTSNPRSTPIPSE